MRVSLACVADAAQSPRVLHPLAPKRAQASRSRELMRWRVEGSSFVCPRRVVYAPVQRAAARVAVVACSTPSAVRNNLQCGVLRSVLRRYTMLREVGQGRSPAAMVQLASVVRALEASAVASQLMPASSAPRELMVRRTSARRA